MTDSVAGEIEDVGTDARDAEARAPWTAWFALTVLVVSALFGFVDRQVLSLMAEPIRHALALSDAQVGMMQGLGFAIFSTLLVFPLGWLSDRYNRRVVLGVCVLVWSASTAACGLARNFNELFVATIGIAAGEAGLGPIIYSALPDLFPFRQRVIANFIFYVSSILGVAAGFGFGGAAIAALGAEQSHLSAWLHGWEAWRLTFVAFATPGPIFVVLIALLRLPRQSHAKPADGKDSVDAPAFHRFIRNEFDTIGLVIGGIGVYCFAYGASYSWFPMLLQRNFGVTPAATGIMLGLALALGSLAGVGSAAYTMRRLVPRLGKAAPIRISRYAMLIGVMPAALQPFATAVWQIMLLAVLIALGGVAAGSLTPNMYQDLSPPPFRARTAAIIMMITGLVGGLGGIMVGAVSDALHHHLLLAIAIVATPAWLLAFELMRRAERPYVRTLHTIATDYAP